MDMLDFSPRSAATNLKLQRNGTDMNSFYTVLLNTQLTAKDLIWNYKSIMSPMYSLKRSQILGNHPIDEGWQQKKAPLNTKTNKKPMEIL